MRPAGAVVVVRIGSGQGGGGRERFTHRPAHIRDRWRQARATGVGRLRGCSIHPPTVAGEARTASGGYALDVELA
jgi:hypothetical protein